MGPGWRTSVAALCALAVLTSCTSDDPSDGSGAGGSGDAAAEAATPWSQAVDAFDPEGEPDVDAALALFTLAFGPVDGLPAPPSEDSGASGDITLAHRAVLGVWDQLTEAQRDAIDAALVPAAETSDSRVIAALPVAGAAAAERRQLADALSVVAADLRAEIATRIGDFTGTLTLVIGTAGASNDLAYTTPALRPDGTFTGDCTVTVLPASTTKGPELLLNTLAHEVFHCFQLAAYGAVTPWNSAPKWVVEGAAEWVAATITTPDSSTTKKWFGYLTRPETPLQTRAYTALGFWAHLTESGTDPWGVFRSVWAARGTPASFEAAGADTPAFLDTWASGFSRDEARGQGWDTTGPGITDDSATPAALPVAVGSAGSAAQAVAFANGLHVVVSTADVLVMSSRGTVRLSAGAIDTVDIDGSRFCQRTGGCSCPDLPDDVPPPLTEPPLIAITGGPTGSSVSIIGLTLDLHCEEKKQAAVQVVVDRPATEGVLAGRILELTSCNGAYGDWSGVLRPGGLSLDGFEVPFTDLPMAFTVGGSGTQTVDTTVEGVVPTPVFDLQVAYDLDITVDGTTMSITGTGNGGTGIVDIEQSLGSQLSGIPIEPAPEGACP